MTVRSLGRRGLQVAAAGTSRNLPAFASRWCARRFVFPTDETSDDYFGRLEEWLDESGAQTLIASHDGTIELLRQQRARLEPRVRLALAPEPALAVAINKERTEEVARRLGIPVPREVLVREAADLPAALKEIGLPAVIKPCESWLANSHERLRAAPVLVVSAAEAARAVERVTRFGMSVLFQQLLSGRREAVSFLYANGQMYARFAQLAARTHPPLGGASVLRQSIAIPRDTGRYAEALVRDINLEGYSEVEFRRGADGVPYLMEINPRLSASVEVAVRAGVDFPFLLYQWASGSPITQQNGYRIGGWMRYLGGDIETTVDSLQQRGRPGISPPVKTIMDFGVSFLKPMGYDYFDWEDPLPAVRAASGFVRTTFKRLGSHMRRVVLGKAAL
ncbi:MAG TPA: ATP-grasp domain-containing protein [Gemmatimonadales bacterium]|nr:ATP-grasp domain-containing protein [Gemmatimonadales bacterium]